MSRFLEHLVARSLGTPGLLQPRLTGRFEPPSIKANAEMVPPVAEMTGQLDDNFRQAESISQVIAISEQLSAALPTLPTNLRATLESLQTKNEQQALSIPASPISSDTQPRSKLIMEAALYQQLSEAPQVVGQIEQLAEPHQRVDLSLPGTSAIRPDRASTTRYPAALSTNIEDRGADLTPTGVERSANASTLVPHIHPIARGATLEETADQPGGSTSLRETPAHAQQLLGEAARTGRDSDHSEPASIQITIGRVEVRAVAPPVPQMARPRAETKLSLDQYLTQRDGGK